ncbi:MAG: hypothetical protein EOM69_07225 [Clostridia bacterium]|nr:hypothetical protein [Clostridia bacterium]
MAEYPDTSETPFFMEGYENAAGEGLYYDAAYYEAATEFPHEQPEPFYEPTSLTAASGPITPEPYEAGLRPSTPPEPRKRDSAGKASQTPRKNPPTHKQVVVRRGTLIACGLLTLFLGMKSGLLLFSTLQNDREVEQAKQDYYQHNGVPLDQSATRVDLLPPGQTYVPTATPVPVITPTPSPRIAVEDAGMAAMAERERQQAALPTDTPCGRVKLKQYPDNPMLVISDRFKTLRQQNKDIVGQITISGLLDELVVQRSDNGYYLTHNAKGEYDTLGAVYADAAISLKRPTENLLLRAKCADSSQGFGPLLRYRDGGEAMVQNYPAIHLSTLFEEADYLIFSCFTAQTNPSASDYFNFSGFPTFSSDKQAASYIQAAQNQSIFPFHVDVLPTDRLLMLATIGGNNDGSCFVILARMMREEEQMTAP